jgi:hypothetical protein
MTRPGRSLRFADVAAEEGDSDGIPESVGDGQAGTVVTRPFAANAFIG